MKPYNSEPHVPTWISALDGELLTPAQLRVLDFIHWCKKHGCRTSNDRIGSFTHCSHKTVERAIQKLYHLDFISIKNYALRTRRLYPVEWTDREQWELYRHLNEKQHPQGGKMFPKTKTDGGQNVPHITTLDKTTPRESSSVVSSESPTTGDVFLPGGCRPQPPACGSVGRGESPTTPEQKKPESKTTSKPKKPMSLYQMKALEHRDKIEFAGRTRAQANQLALAKYPNADFEE